MDRQTHQNYSSEPHIKTKFIYVLRLAHLKRQNKYLRVSIYHNRLTPWLDFRLNQANWTAQSTNIPQ